MATASKKKPAIREIATYAGLEGYLKGYRDGHIGLLVVLGRPGTGKTEMAREVLGEAAGWVTGGSTPLGLYAMLYRHVNRPVVLDDIDNLFNDVKSVALLKAVCQTNPVKRVEWQARPTMLAREGLPPSFATTSRVMVIANAIRRVDADVSAVMNRGIVIRFEPDAGEVHRHVKGWFGDEQIYDWFGERLDRLDGHSSRAYINALALKRSCIDWRYLPGDSPKPDRAGLVRELLADQSFASHADRARAFVSRGGGTTRTFWNYKQRLDVEAKAEPAK